MPDTPPRFLRLLGLARRGGNTVLGAPLIFAALRGGKRPPLVIAASDASDATQKKLRTKCEFYRIPLCVSPYTKESLSHAVGKEAPIAAVAILDAGLAEELAKSSGKDATD